MTFIGSVAAGLDPGLHALAIDAPLLGFEVRPSIVSPRGASYNQGMETIDVRGLPEPVARAIEAMVDTLRRQNNGHKPTTSPPPFPVKRGTVIEPLTREQIYNDGGGIRCISYRQ